MDAPWTLTLAIALLAVPLTGCIAEETADPNAAAKAPSVDELLAGVELSGPAAVQATVDLVKTYPHRNNDLPDHQGARDHLAGALDEIGLEVVRQPFSGDKRVPFVGPEGPAQGYENILGFQWGQVPDEWVVIGGHFDTVERSVEGAYDNGAGVGQVLTLAQALSGVETRRTIVYAFFDGEEQGLWGSRVFVDSITGAFDDWDAEPLEHQGTFVAMFNVDMVGINYPAEPPLILEENSLELREIFHTRAQEMGIPDEKFQCRSGQVGGSDHQSFMDVGTPVVDLGANLDEVYVYGQEYPESYPFWHRADTVETMETAAGGRDLLEQGFQTVLDLLAPSLVQVAMGDQLLSVHEPLEDQGDAC